MQTKSNPFKHTLAAALCGALLAFGPAQAAHIIYSEAVSGDIQGDQNTPTTVGALAHGYNTVTGFDSIASDIGSQGDTFGLTLAADLTIVSIELVVSNYFGADSFTATTFGPGFTNPMQMLLSGDGTYSFAIAPIAGPTTWNFSTQFVTGGPSGFDWAWNVAVVPEPTSVALVGLGLLGLGLSRRRRSLPPQRR